MLPGWVAGHYPLGACEIALDVLALRAGNVAFHQAAAVALDPVRADDSLRRRRRACPSTCSRSHGHRLRRLPGRDRRRGSGVVARCRPDHRRARLHPGRPDASEPVAPERLRRRRHRGVCRSAPRSPTSSRCGPGRRWPTTCAPGAEGRSLDAWHPQQRALCLISTGDRHALASWGRWAWRGRLVWHWKDRIDRRFVNRFGTSA